jgi:integrase
MHVRHAKGGTPLSVAGYPRMVARAGETAQFGFLVHSHMLRHGCGFKLAADGQDTRAIQAYLGHRSIQYRRCATRHSRLIGSRTSGGNNSPRRARKDGISWSRGCD